MSDLDIALDQFEATCDDYDVAESFYDGSRAEVFANSKLKTAMLNAGVQFRINFACTPVDAVLNRLEVKSVQVPGSESDTAILKEIWDRNNLDLEFINITRNALNKGECYAMVWEDDEGPSEIYYNSPKTTQIIYDPEHPRRKLFMAKRWNSGKDTRLNLYYSDYIEKYIAPNVKGCTDSKKFERFVTDVDAEGSDIWPEVNPFGRIPGFHFRTEPVRHPKPEHFNAYGPQDMINKTVVNMMATIDMAGFPQRWILNDPAAASDLDSLSGPDDDFSTEDTVLSNNEPSLTASPGSVWDLVAKAVGQFEAADPAHFLDPIAASVRGMAATTQTPIHNFEGMADPPSGESLRVAEAPTIKKTVIRQKSFGRTGEEMLEFAFFIETGRWVKAQINWQNPASYDDKDWWDVAAQKQAMGIPLHQILIEAGYDPEDAQDWEENYTPPVQHDQVPPTAA